MIEIRNVSKSYIKGNKIIDKLNMKIDNGKIFAFLGPNGVGKTTTIKMITGILPIDEGDILIDGKSINKEPLQAKKRFGYVPDSPDMFLNLKGIEYLNFIADIYNVSKEETTKRIEKYAKKFKIYERLNEKMETYSHGMRQKIIIIGALLHEPQNLILDEPLTGLDPEAAYYLKEIMKEYTKQGKCVFFSTHVLEVAEKLCDEIAIINKGKIALQGEYNQIKEKFEKDKTLEEIFMEIMRH